VVKAGEVLEFGCYINDAYNNPVLNTKLSLIASFKKRAGLEDKGLGEELKFEGKFDWKLQSYVFLPQLFYEGEYSVMVEMRTPGGIAAKYYRDLQFSDLMSLRTDPSDQEGENGPNIDWQDQIHRGILRGLRNIFETP
jgi:hypothetical protein